MRHDPIRKALAAVAVSGLLVAGTAGVAAADDTSYERSEERNRVESTFGDVLDGAFAGNALGNATGNLAGN